MPRLCPACRDPYLYVWTGQRGVLFYVHRHVKVDGISRYVVEGCMIGDKSVIRGVPFSRKAIPEAPPGDQPD